MEEGGDAEGKVKKADNVRFLQVATNMLPEVQ